MATIEVLNPSGHVLLTWDPALQESVDRAKGEFEALRAAGYQFFRVEGGAPLRDRTAFSSGAGALVVKRVEAEEVAPKQFVPDPALDQDDEVLLPETPPKRRPGRPRGSGNTPTERVVATRPMRGG